LAHILVRYVHFAPLSCAREVDDAVDDEKINQQNVVSLYGGGIIRELTSPRVDHPSVVHSKCQIPLGPVPRNFLEANVTRKSPTSYGLVARKLATSPTSS